MFLFLDHFNLNSIVYDFEIKYQGVYLIVYEIFKLILEGIFL